MKKELDWLDPYGSKDASFPVAARQAPEMLTRRSKRSRVSRGIDSSNYLPSPLSAAA